MVVDISREDLERVYIIENRTRKETAEFFGVKPYIISNYTSKYGLRKESQEEVLVRTLKAYSKEKVKELYRTHSYAEMTQIMGVTGDILSAVLKEYGLGKRSKVKNLAANYTEAQLGHWYLEENMGSQELADMLETTPLSLFRVFQKYGITKPKDKVLENIHKTWQEKYGTTNLNLVPEIMEKREQTCLKKYGAKCYLISQQCQSEFRNNSKPNREFAKLLKARGIEFEREFPIANNSFDFKIGNILLEINPYGTHNSTWGLFGKPGKDSKYHFEKSQLAKQNGYRCIHVWDWDDRDKILMLLQPRTSLYARKLQLKEISQLEANRFLKQFHMQNGSREQKVCLGLFREQELIEVMTFGKPRFNKNYEWELIRLCTRPGFRVVGGAEKLLKHFKELKNPKSLISYCDKSKFSGEVYTRLGFTLKSSGLPSKHWYNTKTGVHVTDNGLRMKGFDKLFGEVYGTYGKGTSNDELMRQHDFVEIWDAGQAVYIWNS